MDQMQSLETELLMLDKTYEELETLCSNHGLELNHVQETCMYDVYEVTYAGHKITYTVSGGYITKIDA